MQYQLGHALGHRRGIAIGSIKVNSLLLHIDEVRRLNKDKGFHILAINETKLDDTTADDLLGVERYDLHTEDRERHGGGVTVYVRSSIKHHRRTDIPERALEFVGIEAEPMKAGPLLVVAWYRPPSDPVDSFKKLERNLKFLIKKTRKLLFLETQIVIFQY